MTFTPMISRLVRFRFAAPLAFALAMFSLAMFSMVGVCLAFPKPSPYPISWQLQFSHEMPRRMVVTPSGQSVAEAFWYMRYSVTNNSGEDRTFLPVFEMLADDGQVYRSDEKVSDAILREVRIRERNQDLKSVLQMAGVLRRGIDQSKQGIAVWREPNGRMGRFSIFVGGLSGESVILTDGSGNPVTKTSAEGKTQPVVLRKTFEMDLKVLGDALYPGNDPIELLDETWVMR